MKVLPPASSLDSQSRPMDLSIQSSGLAVSNKSDCRRYGCPHTPWNWASRWVCEQAGFTGTQTACDLGAGDNPVVRSCLAKHTKRAYLVDSILHPRADTLPEHIQSVSSDICSLPFADNSMDVILSVSVLEHLKPRDRDRALGEIFRILKPGGRAVLTIGNLLNASAEARQLLTTLDFFVARQCAVYLPLDLAHLLQLHPELRIAKLADRHYLCPGSDQYEEQALLDHPDLCIESYQDIPAFVDFPDLQRVTVCEIGLVLNKCEHTS